MEKETTTLTIRFKDHGEKTAFLEACKRLDMKGGQIIRHLVRDWMQQQGKGKGHTCAAPR